MHYIVGILFVAVIFCYFCFKTILAL